MQLIQYSWQEKSKSENRKMKSRALFTARGIYGTYLDLFKIQDPYLRPYYTNVKVGRIIFFVKRFNMTLSKRFYS